MLTGQAILTAKRRVRTTAALADSIAPTRDVPSFSEIMSRPTTREELNAVARRWGEQAAAARAKGDKDRAIECYRQMGWALRIAREIA